MQNLNTDMKIKTTGVNKQNGKRWYFPADRRWKVTLDSDGSALVIENSSDLYRVIEGRAFNVRSMRDITENWNAEKYILPLVHYARKAEAQLAAKK